MKGEFLSIETAEKLAKLEKENKRLKGAIETIKETNKLLMQQKAQLQDDLDMSDKRNEKAIEYIKKNILISFDKVGFKTDKVAGIVVDELLEILEK